MFISEFWGDANFGLASFTMLISSTINCITKIDCSTIQDRERLILFEPILWYTLWTCRKRCFCFAFNVDLHYRKNVLFLIELRRWFFQRFQRKNFVLILLKVYRKQKNKLKRKKVQKIALLFKHSAQIT